MDALSVYKALGDDTRFAIYQELGLSPSPLSAAEIADELGLHPNTVRPHLDRMRDAGLVEVETMHRGTVGRPQLRYSLAPGAPGLGLDPPAHTLLAGLLAALADQLGRRRRRRDRTGPRGGPRRSARRQAVAGLSGRPDGASSTGWASTRSTSPRREGGARVRVDFLHCPFRELAEAYPELVCNLHRGIVEGFVDGAGEAGNGRGFHTLADRDPCNMTSRSSTLRPSRA